MNAKNIKKLSTMIALLLTVTIVASIVVTEAPPTSATQYWYYSHIYAGTSAGTRGASQGQSMLLVCWTADMPPDVGEAAGLVSSPNGRAGWYGEQIKVIAPDNTSETIDMPYSDPVGANYISYTPTQVGTYQIQAIFPYTIKNATTTNNIGGNSIRAGDSRVYSAAVSPVSTFEVFATTFPAWVESPLPNDYWTRPVASAARAWYALTSDWLAGAANVWPLGSSGGNVGSYGYGQAPESSHILWTKPFWIGGVMDTRLGDVNYQTSHYQGVSFSPSIILDGKIHYTPRYTTHGSKGWGIIDLYTGNDIYLNYSDTAPNMGQVYLYESPNQHGGFAYLWRTGGGGGFFFGGGGASIQLPEVVVVSNVIQAANLSVIKMGPSVTVNRTQTPVTSGTVWEMLDGYSMKTICYIANVSSSGTQVYGKDGSILYYNTVNKGTTNNPNYYMTVWNSSAGTMVADQAGTGYWQWRPAGGDFGADNPYFSSGALFSTFSMDYNIVHNGNVFYSQNFSIPSLVGPINSRLNETASIRALRQDDFCIVGTQGINDEQGMAPGWLMCFSLAPNASRGQKLWETSFTPIYCPAAQNITTAGMFTGGFSLNGVYPEAGVFTFSEVKQCKRWAFDINTGKQLWEATDPNQFSYYGMSQIVYLNQVIGYGSYSGQLIAYDAKTGNINWVYSSNNTGEESPYGNYPTIVGAVADGKIYTYTSEHSYTHPLYRGPNLRCINATDGSEIFSILDFGGGMAIADGRLVVSNSMDNEIYCYGRGPSATTVAASPDVSSFGSAVMVKGTVTDQTTTGRRNTNGDVDWTLQGTPAISDADMSAWMEYKFMQQVYPADAKGVPVSIDIIDPNNNFFNVGSVTSDIHGNFAIPFTPSVPGTYQVIATFAGSGAYGPSSATTYINVGEAAPAPATATPTPVSIADQYFVPATIGIIVAIIAIGAVTILALRKRP